MGRRYGIRVSAEAFVAVWLYGLHAIYVAFSSVV
jgi:hypothetical protein